MRLGNLGGVYREHRDGGQPIDTPPTLRELVQDGLSQIDAYNRCNELNAAEWEQGGPPEARCQRASVQYVPALVDGDGHTTPDA